MAGGKIMAVIIEEPNVDGFDHDDLQNFIARTTFQGGEYLKVSIDITNTPFVRKGSRLEVNGAFYVVNENEDIEEVDSNIVNEWLYIYAVPEEKSLSFIFSAYPPEYDDIKLGWYDEEKRAIAKIYKTANTWDGLYMLRYKESIQGMERPVGTIVTHIHPDMENELGRVFGGIWAAYPWKENDAYKRSISPVQKSVLLSTNISTTNQTEIFNQKLIQNEDIQRISIVYFHCANTDTYYSSNGASVLSNIRGLLANVSIPEKLANANPTNILLGNFNTLPNEIFYVKLALSFSDTRIIVGKATSELINNPSDRVEYLYIRIK
jgi:hypothetical protein